MTLVVRLNLDSAATLRILFFKLAVAIFYNLFIGRKSHMEWEVSGRSWEVLLWPQIEAFLITLTAFYFIFPFNPFSQVVPWFILVFFAKILFSFLKNVGVLFPLLGEHTGFLGSSPLKGVQGNVPFWVTLTKPFCFPAVFCLLQGSGKREFAGPTVSMAPRWHHLPLQCPIPGWIFLP